MFKFASALSAALLLMGLACQGAEASTECPSTLIKAEKKYGKSIKLTPAQRHFIEGAFTATPPIGTPPPSGDGAVMFKIAGENGIIGYVTWTRGPLVCGGFAVSSNIIGVMLGTKTDKNETDDNSL